MYSLHCHVRYVQAVRESRVFGTQCRGEESNGQEKRASIAVVQIQRFPAEAVED